VYPGTFQGGHNFIRENGRIPMATKISIKDPNPGIWFKFNDDDPGSGEISIRAVNQARRLEMQKKTVKRKVEYKHGQRFEVTDIDDEMFSQMLWDYVIAGWKKLEDDDGQMIECTTENKVFLMQNNVGFATFVGQCMEKVNEGLEERLKDAEKNSLSGSSASATSQTVKSAGRSRATDSTQPIA
jgi:hypothetical protein